MLDWDPVTNTVRLSPAAEVEERPASQTGGGVKPAAANPAREPDTRYALVLENFRAARLTDADSPFARTEIDRRFQLDTEIPEARIKALFEQVLSSPLVPQVAALIEQRLGRKLEPQDLYYAGFLERAKYPEAQLDAITRKKYQTAEAYHAGHAAPVPRARLLPRGARKDAGPGTTSSSIRRAARATRATCPPDAGASTIRTFERASGADGMDYKGYNIAVHEMGHNVEQTFSLNLRRSPRCCQGVPEQRLHRGPGLHLSEPRPRVARPGRAATHSHAPDASSTTSGQTWEISGAALVDMAIWRWLYAHPDATPAQLREATLGIARDALEPLLRPGVGQERTPSCWPSTPTW